MRDFLQVNSVPDDQHSEREVVGPPGARISRGGSLTGVRYREDPVPFSAATVERLIATDSMDLQSGAGREEIGELPGQAKKEF
jgi:hypothetical protein